MNDGKDISCVICGYDLRGLSAQTRCPECGVEVRRSLHGDLLEYADLRWLLSVQRGTSLITWSIILFLAGWVLTFAFGLMLSSLGVLTAINAVGRCLLTAFPAIAVASAVTLCWGVWLFTRQEPRELGVEEQVSLRRLTRAAVIVVVLLLLARLVLVFGSFGRYVDAVTVLVFLCASAGTARRVYHLAQRLPGSQLARMVKGAARRLLLCTAGAIGVGLVVYVVLRVGPTASAALGIVATLGTLGAACLVLIPFIGLAVAFEGLREELSRLVRMRKKRELS